MKERFNLQYGILWATYWMYYGVVNSFCSVFLLDRGYSNYTIGLVFTISAVISVVLQPPVANLADNSKRFTLHRILEIMGLGLVIFTCGLFVMDAKSLALTVLYTGLLTVMLSMHGLINAIKGRVEDAGKRVNYGLDRSMGSVGYSILVALLGMLVERYSSGILPYVGVGIMAIFVLFTFINERSVLAAAKSQLKTVPREKREEAGEEIGLMAFLMKNRMFMVLCIGTVLAYVSNQVINNYMLQIITPLGGNSEDMGLVCAVVAGLEIPTMVLYVYINRKFKTTTLVKVSAIGFIVKSLLFTIAPNMTVIYLASLSQPFAYALMMPAMVHYIDEIMETKEAVKGQASYVTATVIGSVIASLSGGILLDLFSARVMMAFATVLGAIGAVIMIFAINRIPNTRKYKFR